MPGAAQVSVEALLGDPTPAAKTRTALDVFDVVRCAIQGVRVAMCIDVWGRVDGSGDGAELRMSWRSFIYETYPFCVCFCK